MSIFSFTPHLQQHLVPSPTLFINERVQQMWSAGQTVYHFGFGESRFPVHPKLQAALRENAHQKGYLPVQGLADLREAIAAHDSRHLNLDFGVEQVIVAPGSKALLFGLLMMLDGDLLLPTPSWVTYAPQAQMLNKPVHFIPASVESGYELTIENLDKTVQQSSSNQKILIINSPNNPTGRMLSDGFLQELAGYCRQNRILVLSDEIYGRVTHGNHTHISLAKYYPEGTAVIGGLSKHLSLGGWRVGKAILPKALPELMAGLCSVASEIWSSASAPIQYAATLAYNGDPEIEAYIDTCSRLHTVRSQHIWSWLNEMGIQCAQPEGGFYMAPNFDRWREPLARQGVTTSTQLASFLLEDYQIATLPGSVLGIPENELSLRMATSFIDMETDGKAQQMLNAWEANSNEEIMTNNHPMTQQAIQQFQTLIADLG
ncbi:MAG: aminotransferase class I/II-fold pyridoxal phosphate-dependent enzyme [Chloroflexi bacterium]|nr:aminotransferase class I/II-fold pyridoxal phosphate-dependent enzyme [Chloroflexota bacterium]